jgi:hypothetical protein
MGCSVSGISRKARCNPCAKRWASRRVITWQYEG